MGLKYFVSDVGFQIEECWKFAFTNHAHVAAVLGILEIFSSDHVLEMILHDWSWVHVHKVYAAYVAAIALHPNQVGYHMVTRSWSVPNDLNDAFYWSLP
jgi:hypothetical protein